MADSSPFFLKSCLNNCCPGANIKSSHLSQNCMWLKKPSQDPLLLVLEVNTAFLLSAEVEKEIDNENLASLGINPADLGVPRGRDSSQYNWSLGQTWMTISLSSQILRRQSQGCIVHLQADIRGLIPKGLLVPRSADSTASPAAKAGAQHDFSQLRKPVKWRSKMCKVRNQILLSWHPKACTAVWMRPVHMKVAVIRTII